MLENKYKNLHVPKVLWSIHVSKSDNWYCQTKHLFRRFLSPRFCVGTSYLVRIPCFMTRLEIKASTSNLYNRMEVLKNPIKINNDQYLYIYLWNMSLQLINCSMFLFWKKNLLIFSIDNQQCQCLCKITINRHILEDEPIKWD